MTVQQPRADFSVCTLDNVRMILVKITYCALRQRMEISTLFLVRATSFLPNDSLSAENGLIRSLLLVCHTNHLCWKCCQSCIGRFWSRFANFSCGVVSPFCVNEVTHSVLIPPPGMCVLRWNLSIVCAEMSTEPFHLSVQRRAFSNRNSPFDWEMPRQAKFHVKRLWSQHTTLNNELDFAALQHILSLTRVQPPLWWIEQHPFV